MGVCDKLSGFFILETFRQHASYTAPQRIKQNFKIKDSNRSKNWLAWRQETAGENLLLNFNIKVVFWRGQSWTNCPLKYKESRHDLINNKEKAAFLLCFNPLLNRMTSELKSVNNNFKVNRTPLEKINQQSPVPH